MSVSSVRLDCPTDCDPRAIAAAIVATVRDLEDDDATELLAIFVEEKLRYARSPS